MEIRCQPVAFDTISHEVRHHLATLPSAIDSFLEGHILASNHYRVLLDGETAGHASIHGENLITQFTLESPFKTQGQRVFAEVRRLENVQSAFVPTCDEFFLSHALDDQRHLAKQAFFFATGPECRAPVPSAEWRLRVAGPADAGIIRDGSGTFFGDIEPFIDQQALFLTARNEDVVGFGLIERSTLYDNVASIGMYTVEPYRHRGAGTATIRLLMDECDRRGLRPIAGCWYYNHASKRTLERAGMYSATRLLKIDF